MSNEFSKFYSALEAMNDGDTVILARDDTGPTDAIKSAKAYARQRGFSVRLSADYNGIAVHRISEHDSHTISKALDGMANGCTIVLPLDALAMPTLRKEIGRREDTGLVAYEAAFVSGGIRVHRNDLFTDSQLKAYMAGLESVLGSDHVEFHVDEGTADMAFRKRVDLFGMVIHQPLAVMRTSHDTVCVFYDRR